MRRLATYARFPFTAEVKPRVDSGLCCLSFDPFSTLGCRQRYVKDFIACENSRFFSLFAAVTFRADLPPRETSPTAKEQGETAVFAGYGME